MHKIQFGSPSLSCRGVQKALSDFEGCGDLETLPADIALRSDCAAQFLKHSPQGPISVTASDSLAVSRGEGLIVKLYVEGDELAALRGAACTVKTASNIILAMGAHPLVTRRTGIDPVECLRLLSTWRTCTFIAAESSVYLDIRRPVFDQLPLSRLSWNWKERSSAKITERTHAQRAKALHIRREGHHPQTPPVG